MKCWITLFLAIVTIQCISVRAASTKLAVSGLALTTTERSLTDLFKTFGNVQDVIIIRDRETGRSKGSGFVIMSTKEEADAAIKGTNGSVFEGKRISVKHA